MEQRVEELNDEDEKPSKLGPKVVEEEEEDEFLVKLTNSLVIAFFGALFIRIVSFVYRLYVPESASDEL
jgi:hypothetical protein